jgi:enamine deaminase RidA (YjgF/YER057c/UK114 family)
MPTIRRVNPGAVHKPIGYSHLTEVTGGRLVFTSGQVAVDPAGNIVGEGDISAQVTRVFENLKSALTAVGADFTHVVKFTYFITDPSQIGAVREIRNRYIDTESPPASTLVVVAALARPAWLIEIEAVAAVPA